MTTAVVKLVKGARTLDLMTAPYNAGPDFRPPSTSYNVGLAGGGSANITGGATIYARKYINQQFSFQIKLSSTSDGGINEAIRGLNAFMALAGDENDPLYLCYKSNSDTPEPLWGQYGANYRYEIVDGSISGMWDSYGLTTLRARTVFVTVALTLKPFALGKPQRVATATGGILEDVIGSDDGRSQGVVIPEATINLFTNPVFGYGYGSTTWNTGWSAGASIVSACNVLADYCLPGTVTSAYLTSTASTANTYTQAINMGTTNPVTISCYAKRTDGGAISASQLVIYYGSTGSRATTYASAGAGWYRLTASSLTGLNAACATGVVVKKNAAAYVSGFQIEEKPIATPLAYGDLVGCAWSGSVHGSTSTRTAALCKIPIDSTTLRSAAGSIRVIWQPDRDSTADWTGTTAYLFYTSAFYGYYHSGADVFGFNDGVNGVSTTAKTFSAGDILALHFTWDSSTGINIYLNGTSVGTNTTFSNPPTLGDSIFVGTYSTGAAPVGGRILGFATFDRALTATEIANDYATIAPIVARDERVESVPWFWTDDGDNVLGLATGKQPLGVAAGVTGDAPAITEVKGILSSAWSTIKGISLSSYACDAYLGLSALLYDYSGSATAGDYGGEHKTTTVNVTTGQSLSQANPILSAHVADQINGMEYSLLTRIAGAASAVNIYSAWENTGVFMTGDTRAITPAAGWGNRLFRTKSNRIKFNVKGFQSLNAMQISHYLFGSKIGADVALGVDYIAILPRPSLLVTGGNISATGFAVKGTEAYQVDLTLSFEGAPLVTTGDKVELVPDKLNHILCYCGVDETIDPAITYTVTLSQIYVTPRWLLL